MKAISEVNKRFQYNTNRREELMNENDNGENQNPRVIVLKDHLYCLYRNG